MTDKGNVKMNWRQSSVPCKNCGSYYRVDDKCNKCGEFTKEPAREEVRRVIGGRKGKLWSKRLHRYLTEDEIRNGYKGG